MFTQTYANILRKDPPEIAKILKAHGAEQTLAVAAMAGDNEAVLHATKSGADVNAKDQYGRTALMQAVWAGRFDTAKLLLEQDADVNAGDSYGRSALMLATWTDKPGLVKLLLDHGADTQT